ncbi:MAG TPA: cupredoxin domain-containing protein [Anaerolineales bacterium]|nr:cupredoxin domain-containing protein [Anaerolineales bacterium]
MTQTFKWTGLVLFAAAIGLALAVLFASGAQAESPIAVVQPTPYPGPAGYGYRGGYGPGMMGRGWSGYGSWGMGPGMMGSYGYGHMGGMMGGYGGWGYGSGAAPQGTPIPVDEEIQLEAANFRFDPATITVKAGETVRLVVANKDGTPHNLYSPEAALAYTLLPAGVVQSVTFTAPTTPGTYLTVCTFHPGMNLEIVVK